MITRFEATLALNPDKLVYQDGEPNKIYVDNILVTDFTEIDKKVEETRKKGVPTLQEAIDAVTKIFEDEEKAKKAENE